ncbi:uncharacterized protein E0L32_010017 [Thyridium curvatum]|uniref:Major facilitator superfamily (MFS) profile domain-containing protein n=1 Tax=Thyridium curvatum TaxID=1093900 RepID=A0A507AW92_9PEZI|nr:uncharacterized protein E0L32_010017 [Thyridium curvatum]TPX08530.1 hypothetical protein E0L32_010017 [Thyridium curvatum]
MAGPTPHTAANLTLFQRLKFFNPMLIFIMIYLAMCAFNFGYDVATFGGVQAMQSFGRRFGEQDPKTLKWALPGWLSSVMTATPFFGKALGCISCGWIAEKWGRRAAILALCIVSVVGVVLQTAAVNSAMFTIGRIITFAMTGMAIVVVPIYQSETAPEVLRGMFASTIQLMISIGGIVAAGVTYGTKSMQSDAGWRIPTGLQLVMPALIFLFLPVLPESPRWLLSQDRRDDACKSLRKLRKKATEEEIQLEIEALQFAHANQEKGTWAEVFDKSNRVRTGVAVLAMFGQQITGQAFPSQYAVIFYQSQGFGDRSFLLNEIMHCLGLVAILCVWLFVDGLGRRPILLFGGTLMGLWLFVLGGIGSIDQKALSEIQKNVMVASLMLFSFSFNLSWAPASYIVVSEAAASRVKEKTNLLACVISVLTTFVTSFTLPYLINAKYANLGAKVGYIFGAINIVMVILVFFFIPELRGRTLEEVDQLFASGEPLRKFKNIETRRAEELYEAQVEGKGRDGVSEVNVERA